jgi:hypothetical protein
MSTNINESQRKSIRTAGLLYLLMAISAPIGLIYVMYLAISIGFL